MLTSAFVIALILGLALNYFFVELPRRRAGPPEPTLPDPVSPARAVDALPGGASLQPTLTWTRPSDGRSVFLGIHPLLVSLVGAPYKLKLTPEDWQIWKGAPLIRIRRGRRELQVPSPLSGRILEVNPVACGERGGTHPEEGEGCWVYRIEPVDLYEEAPHWVTGAEARKQLDARYREIRDHLLHARAGKHSAPVVLDGEELPIGVLGGLPREAWKEFQTRFLPLKPRGR